MDSKKYDEMSSDEKRYSHILINKAQRTGLWVVLFMCWLFTASFLMQYMLQGVHHWMLVAVIASLLCLPVTIFPVSESWTYEPWQAKPRKYEHHHKD